ncbi:tetraspanin-11 isoform X2 [Delphinapterus leucas]|uniref:Tetraspanin-11 isoform X2 n=1 Tax=Delphinapterus leucas TaxID=9749 RepID=A0A2Y9NDL3_DELLE|nr:tetraspanin-11 isoform X2 [Delphinapterus leucas]
MAHYKVDQDDWLTVYLKYLLAVFNFFFWMGGAAVMAVGVWTLVEKSGYLGVLASSTFAASAYILIFAGTLVMVTGFLGFSAVIREDRSCLSAYFCLLLVIFLVELVAGVLAHVYYQRLSEELRQHLTRTLAQNYRQPGAAEITASVDRLQQDFRCCGSNSSADWQHSTYILSPEAEGRRVPDSCCKTVVARCGRRAHPSNIYKVEGGCITKLEQFLADHLLLMGAVGIGVACLQPRKHEGKYLGLGATLNLSGTETWEEWCGLRYVHALCVCTRGCVCTACCGLSGSMGVSACTWVYVVGAGCTYVFRRAVHMCIFSCMDTRSFLCVCACV